MRYYLSRGFVLRRLETPCLYDIRNDELYELDQEGFDFLLSCSEAGGCDAGSAATVFLRECLSEGILTIDPVASARSAIQSSPVPSLRYLEFQITDRCNLRCRHCYVGEPRNRELSFAQCKAVMDEFETMQGLRLLITGGEPLLHGNFREFNECLPDYSFRKVLFSNGLLLDRKLISELHIDELQISIDGMEAGHDAVRGDGTFRKAVRALREALDAGMQVSVATMVHSRNLSEFDEMESLFREIGIREWTVDVPCSEGRLKEYGDLYVDPETGGKYFKYGFGGGLHSGGEGFGCGLHLAAVLAGGEICKCAFYGSRPAGTIDEGLKTVWSRIKAVSLDDLQCAKLSCSVIDECRGGCRYRASLNSGNCTEHAEIYGKGCDFYKCVYYGIMK